MNAPVVDEIAQTERPRDVYLEGLLKQWEGKQWVERPQMKQWLQTLRQKAAAQVLRSKMPSKQDEDWRFTDLGALQQIDFRINQPVSVSPGKIAPFAFPEVEYCLVFVNGAFAPQLSNEKLPEGIYAGSLDNLDASQSQKITQYLAQQDNTDVFESLNTSAIADIAVIWVNANVAQARPIHLLYLTTTDTPALVQPRTLVIAERGASLTVIEHYATSIPQALYFTNSVTEIWVEENAQVNHSRLQLESEQSYHIGRSRIVQARDNRYHCSAIDFGGKLSRHNLEVYQTGEQTETGLYGLTLAGGQQLADTHSLISLSKPYGTTEQLHKCIVGDRAHAVFNGKVLVPKAAQLTNAAQLNRNLLLSPKARVDTKPELQITADNVKCSHGATVSQLEAEEIFYLRSRGLSETEASHLLIDAFAAEILNRLPIDSLKTQLAQAVTTRNLIQTS